MRQGWRSLRSVVVAMVIGFTALLLTVQVRTERTIRQTLGIPSPQLTDLGYRLRRAEAQRRRLETEVGVLRDLVALARRSAVEGPEGLRALGEEADRLRVAAGLIPLEGPGVVVAVRDSPRALRAGEDPNDVLVHYTDLQALVNELWAAGAEAVAINGERLTPVSSIQCVGTTVLINRRRISPPFEVEAIGDSGALAAYLLRADGTVGYLRTFEFPVSVRAAGALRLPAYRGPFQPGGAWTSH